MALVNIADIIVKTNDSCVREVNEKSYCMKLNNTVPAYIDRKHDVYVAVGDVDIPMVTRSITYKAYFGRKKPLRVSHMKTVTHSFSSYQELARKVSAFCNDMYDEEAKIAIDAFDEQGREIAAAETRAHPDSPSTYSIPFRKVVRDEVEDLVIQYFDDKFHIFKGYFVPLYLSWNLAKEMKLASDRDELPFFILKNTRLHSSLERTFFLEKDLETCYIYFPSLCKDKTFVNSRLNEFLFPIDMRPVPYAEKKFKSIIDISLLKKTQSSQLFELYFSFVTKALTPYPLGYNLLEKPAVMRILFFEQMKK